MTMTKEFDAVVEKLLEQYDVDGCDYCPYADVCGQKELYWGCGVWEAQMGEDL